MLRKAMERFVEEIKDGTYPGPEHSFKIAREELAAFSEYAETR